MQRRIMALLAGLTLIGALAAPVAAAVPDAPTGVSASVSGDTISVSWTAPAAGDPATGYTINLDNGGGSTTSNGTSADFPGVEPGTYIATVTATNDDGDGGSASSNQVVVEDPASVPDAPEGVSASLVGETSVSVSWSAPGNDGGSAVIDYTVSLDNGGGSQTVGGTSFQFDGLTPGVTYTATVTARNDVGSSGGASSNGVLVPVPPDPDTVPDAPEGVSASLVGETSVSVSWSAPGNDGGSAVIDYTVSLDNGGGSQTVGGTSFQFDGLTPGVTYTATVTARNDVGSSGGASSSGVLVPVPPDPDTVPDAPEGVSASLVGETSVSVSWSAPGNDGGSAVIDYTVSLDNGGGSQTVGGTSFQFDGLTPGVTYTATVTARNDVGSSGGASSNGVLVPVPPDPDTVPDAPEGVSASLVGETSVSVSWSAPGNDGGSPVTGYRVSLTGQDDQIVDDTFASFGGLAPGDYTATVVAINAVGDSAGATSNTVTLNAPAPVAPDAPGGLNLTASGTQVSASWSDANDNGSAVTNYRVTLSDGQTTDTGTGLGATFDVAPGTYTFTVFATNAGGDSPTAGPSNSVTIDPPAGVPDAPGGVSASASGDTQVDVSWSAPGNDGGSPVTGYRVSLTGQDDQIVDDTFASFGGLAPGDYTATVVAINAVGDSAGATSNTVTLNAPVTAPDAPSGLALTVLGNNQLLASWDAPNDNGATISNYQVRLSDGRNFDTGTNTQFTIDAQPGSYSFNVVASNAAGTSGQSSQSNTVNIASLPDAPNGVSASVNGSTVTINWNAPNDNGSPIEFYTITLSNGQVDFSGVTNRSFTLPAGVYSATVTATNGVGEGPSSASSNSVEVQTQSSAPASVDATANGANVTVTWSPPANDGGSAITSYVVTLSGPTGTTPVTVDGNTFSALFSNLGPGSYTASVVASNAFGTSPSASVNVSVGALTPSAPRDVQAIARGQEVTVTWSPPSDGGNTPITGYEISIGLLVATVNDASATSVVFDEVPEGTYVASVRAINGAGAGDAGVSNEFGATPPFAPFYSPDAFVAQQYQDFLGRAPDAAGLAFWKSLIDDDPANAPAVIESFMSSPEFAPRRQVARLYLAYFDRPPDRDGFDFWSELFISRQADLGVISAAFADSEEFQRKYGSLSDIEFVALVYNNVLLRAPDGPGITYWTNLLGEGMNRGEMMVFFSESPEFVIKSAPAVDVIVTYRGMLDRAPDPVGYRFWVRAVAQSQDSLGDLIEGFLVSPEYSNRITP